MDHNNPWQPAGHIFPWGNSLQHPNQWTSSQYVPNDPNHCRGASSIYTGANLNDAGFKDGFQAGIEDGYQAGSHTSNMSFGEFQGHASEAGIHCSNSAHGGAYPSYSNLTEFQGQHPSQLVPFHYASHEQSLWTEVHDTNITSTLNKLQTHSSQSSMNNAQGPEHVSTGHSYNTGNHNTYTNSDLHDGGFKSSQDLQVGYHLSSQKDSEFQSLHEVQASSHPGNYMECSSTLTDNPIFSPQETSKILFSNTHLHDITHSAENTSRAWENVHVKESINVERENSEQDIGSSYSSDDDEASSDSSVDNDNVKLWEKAKKFVDELCGSTKPISTNNIELNCIICHGVQRYKGWNALLAHAGTYKKRKAKKHRQLKEILESILRNKEQAAKDGDVVVQPKNTSVRASFINSDVRERHIIVWPPAVILEVVKARSFEREGKSELQDFENKGAAKNMIKDMLSDELRDLHPNNIISCTQNTYIILFATSSVGYMEAKELHERFRRKRSGKDGLRDKKFGVQSKKKYVIFGYIAEPEDMKIIDPERIFVKEWSEESYEEKVQGASIRTIKEKEVKKFALLETKVEMKSLSEKQNRFKIQNQLLSEEVEMKTKQIEEQDKRTNEIRARYDEEERRLNKKYKLEMDEVSRVNAENVRIIKQQIELADRQYEDARTTRMRQIESRRQELKELKESHQNMAERKALEAEAAAMNRRKSFMAEVQKAEVDLNEKIREVESSLQDKQQEEMMKLIEESNRERNALYEEWLNEHNTLSKDAAKEIPEQNNVQKLNKECCICFEELTFENIAVFTPCGHARCCIDCAREVFAVKGLCPVCRQKLLYEPCVCPKELLGIN